jgi:hypothetical protein
METLEGQLPINEYPVTDDEEIVPKGIDVGNAAFKRGNVAGDASNHSSTRMSIPKGTLVWNDPKQTYASMGEGTQWNDDEDGMSSQGHDDINNDYDPNMSGPKPTQQLEDWRAGMLSPWQENDDYRDYTFKTDNVVESRLLAQSSQLRVTYKAPGNVNDYSDIEDNDYDDNGGWATAIPQDGGPSNDGLDPRGVHPEDQEPQDAFGSGPSDIAGIALYPIVRRL